MEEYILLHPGSWKTTIKLIYRALWITEEGRDLKQKLAVLLGGDYLLSKYELHNALTLTAEAQHG